MRANGRRILLSANSSWNLLNFRRPIIEALVGNGYEVSAAVPADGNSVHLAAMGVEVHHIRIDARGLSPAGDLALLARYFKLMRALHPEAFLGFTVKPNVYGSIAASAHGIPVFNTISGLGTAFLSGRALEMAVARIYRVALRRSTRVFFHNVEDRDMFVSRHFVTERQAEIVAGSGVDVTRFSPAREEHSTDRPTFLFIGRILRDKGAREFAEAAAIVRQERRACFRMLGPVEDHPKAVPKRELDRFVSSGAVELLGQEDDVRPFIDAVDCVVLPSYREGLPRVLLEAGAMAKPVIATDVPGCRQAVDDGVTGLLCKPRSARALADAMMRFIDMGAENQREMGRRGRDKAVRDFSAEGVVQAYLKALHAAEL